MIKATPGHRVRIEDPEHPERPPRFWGVEAWDEDGHPMVVTHAGLVRADTVPGYVEIDFLPDPDPEPFAFLPGGGWTAEYEDGSREPVVGWAVCTYGGGDATFAVPMTVGEEASFPSGKLPLAKMVEGRDEVKIHPPASGRWRVDNTP